MGCDFNVKIKHLYRDCCDFYTNGNKNEIIRRLLTEEANLKTFSSLISISGEKTKKIILNNF